MKIKMIDLALEKPELCCGCSACAVVCPKNAITMKVSDNGFKYPIIDSEKCVECGLCLKTCDFKNFKPTGKKPQVYAARHKDPDELATSTSGGYFMAVCQYVIENNGVVFGSRLDENLKCVHAFAETYEDCKKFKGSKYVQSDMGDMFSHCEQFLKNGRMVCFSGTGCQVHGLLSYLKTKKVSTEKLITIDIVCHGVPSPGVWDKYIEVFQKNTQKKITAVDFRDKDYSGWAAHVEKYSLDDLTEIHSRQWTTCFYRHILFRESCFNCKYTTTERNSDFTIADYWGLEKNAPEFNDNKGCSLVMIHSEKGKTVFNIINKYLNYKETKLESSMQPQMSRPVWKGWDYGYFWKKYKKNPQKAVKKYFFPSNPLKLFWKVEGCGKKVLKAVLKKTRKRKA